jgi:hypothetical protein
MNEIPEALRLYRGQLRDAVERDVRRRRPRAPRLVLPTAAMLAAAATIAVVVGLMLGAASPSADAAARKALAATAAVNSGTMTMTWVVGDHTTVRTTQWNGADLSVADDPAVHDAFAIQELLVGGNVYVQLPDGTWQHYASEADAGYLDASLHVARADVAGTSAAQVLALVPGLKQAAQPDGTTVYSGTIQATGPGHVPVGDITPATVLGARLQSVGRESQLRMVVGSDGLVSQLSETADDGSASWTIRYSQLDSTPPISAPASFTEGTTPTSPPPPQPVAPAAAPGG